MSAVIKKTGQNSEILVHILPQSETLLVLLLQKLAADTETFSQNCKEFLNQLLTELNFENFKELKLNKTNWQISLVLCDDVFISGLNSLYLGKEGPTDILSFPSECGGDLILSLPAWLRNCENFVVDEEEELQRLLIHGLLHLGGWDHDDQLDKEVSEVSRAQMSEMLEYQEILLKQSLRRMRVLPL